MALKDIAREAGVSIATVSYVLNGSGHVSEATRKKILKLAEKYDYSIRPPRCTRPVSTNTIGVLVEDIRIWCVPGIVQGITQFAEANGKHVILSGLGMIDKIHDQFDRIVEYKTEINDAIRVLLGAKVDGIIFVGMHDRNVDNIIKKINKPLVYTYCYTDNPEDIIVGYNNMEISREIGSDLAGLGHKKIGVISGAYANRCAHVRFCGFEKAMKDHGIVFDNRYLRIADWSMEAGYRAAMELLQMDNRPTAIYAMNDELAMGVIWAARQCGISVPGQLSVVGFDNREFSRYVSPSITTVQMPWEEMGSRAAKAIYQVLEGSKPNNYENIIPCKMILRESTARCEN